MMNSCVVPRVPEARSDQNTYLSRRGDQMLHRDDVDQSDQSSTEESRIDE